MDIFEHIKKEHRETEGMLQKLSGGYDEGLVSKLKLALTAHMKAEEASLYPAMQDKEREMVEHAQEEHEEIRSLLGGLDQGGSDFTSKLSELTKVINDHVQEEEQEMIPKAQEMFDRSKINDLSSTFDEVDERIMERAK
jgi:hemerythrin superfamily protein